MRKRARWGIATFVGAVVEFWLLFVTAGERSVVGTKYFYYISQSKVDMLLGQVRRSRLAVPKIKPKISVAGIEVGAEIESQADRSLVQRTLSLVETMEKTEQIRKLGRRSELNTSDFWHDEGTWFNGLYRFGTDPKIIAYFLWKTHRDSILLLVGSPLNVLGERNVQGEAVVSGTAGTLQLVFDAVFLSLGPDVALIDRTPDLARQIEGLGTAPDVQRVVLRPSYAGTSAPSTAVALGILCLRCLSTLPRNKVDTVFRVFHETEIRVPEDLPAWITEVEEFKNRNRESLGLEKVRRVGLGSPIYTALL